MIVLHVSRIYPQTCQGIKQELASAKNTANEIDIFHWTASAALELIGEAGLGYSFNSFGGERNEYYYAVKSVMFVLQYLMHSNIYI